MKLENLEGVQCAKKMLEEWNKQDKNAISNYCTNNNVTEEEFFKKIAKITYSQWEGECNFYPDTLGCSPAMFMKDVLKKYLMSAVKGVILNYTPHTVNIINSKGEVIQDFPSMGEIRCQQTSKKVGQINNVPVSSTCFGEVIGLPKEQKGTYYIVSRLVKQACPFRQDLLVPNELVRDSKGQIVGCKSLANN